LTGEKNAQPKKRNNPPMKITVKFTKLKITFNGPLPDALDDLIKKLAANVEVKKASET
jgi:hypothetical protein